MGADQADLGSAETYLRKVHAPFGALTDAQWRHMMEYSFVPDPSGGVRPHYDPAIAETFRPAWGYGVSLWRYWDRIRCPVLLIRGEKSDLLTLQTSEEMRCRGPRTQYAEIAGCGHAPALMDAQQIALVSDWIV